MHKKNKISDYWLKDPIIGNVIVRDNNNSNDLFRYLYFTDSNDPGLPDSNDKL